MCATLGSASVGVFICAASAAGGQKHGELQREREREREREGGLNSTSVGPQSPTVWEGGCRGGEEGRSGCNPLLQASPFVVGKKLYAA